MTENWKTSVGGILLAVGVGASGAPVPEKYVWAFKVMEAAGAIMIGITAKDFNVHSTVQEVNQATVEAAKKEREK